MLGLVMVSLMAGCNVREDLAPTPPGDPSGTWNFEYLPGVAPNLTGKSIMVVSSETTTFQGKNYFKVTEDKRDIANRGIRFYTEAGQTRLAFLLAGDPNQPTKLGV